MRLVQLEGALIDLADYRIIWADGTSVDLLPQEQRVLAALAAAGRVLTFAELAQLFWGDARGYSDQAVSRWIYRLRLKLGPARQSLQNVARVGYRLVLPQGQRYEE